MTRRRATRVPILIVEDDYLIAEALGGLVRGMGHKVVGPASSVRDALDLLDDSVSIALVDINLGGEPITPLVTALQAARIPFAFLSAYPNACSVRPDLASVPFFRKPVSQATLLEAVTLLLSRAPVQFTLGLE